MTNRDGGCGGDSRQTIGGPQGVAQGVAGGEVGGGWRGVAPGGPRRQQLLVLNLNNTTNLTKSGVGDRARVHGHESAMYGEPNAAESIATLLPRAIELSVDFGTPRTCTGPDTTRSWASQGGDSDAPERHDWFAVAPARHSARRTGPHLWKEERLILEMVIFQYRTGGGSFGLHRLHQGKSRVTLCAAVLAVHAL